MSRAVLSTCVALRSLNRIANPSPTPLYSAYPVHAAHCLQTHTESWVFRRELIPHGIHLANLSPAFANPFFAEFYAVVSSIITMHAQFWRAHENSVAESLQNRHTSQWKLFGWTPLKRIVDQMILMPLSGACGQVTTAMMAVTPSSRSHRFFPPTRTRSKCLTVVDGGHMMTLTCLWQYGSTESTSG